jgi:hypothetical protein
MFNPAVAPRGDYFTFQGLQSLGSNLRDMFQAVAQKQQQEQEKQAALQRDLAQSNVIVNTLRSVPGFLTSDDLYNYQTGDAQTKIGIANGAAKAFATKAILGEGVPQPMRLPDGSSLPGQFYVPGAKQVIRTSPPPSKLTATPPVGLQVPAGYYWDGSKVVPLQKPAAGPPPANLTIPPGMFWNGQRIEQIRQGANNSLTDDIAQLEAQNRQSQLDAINKQIADAQANVAAGNVRAGPDWLPIATPYADQVKGLVGKRDALLNSPGVLPVQSEASTLPETTGIDPAVALTQARAKIQAGADPALVKQRLQQLGVDPSGL